MQLNTETHKHAERLKRLFLPIITRLDHHDNDTGASDATYPLQTSTLKKKQQH